MKNRSNSAKTPTAIVCALIATAMSGPAMPADLSQALSSDKRVSLFANAAAKAGLGAMLKGPGSYVLFIPSDRALADEGSDFLLSGVLLTESNAKRLADMVRHHVARVEAQGADLAEDVELRTLADVPLDVAHVGTGLMIAGHAAVTGHIVADNGVVYIVDRLLWPRDARWSQGTTVLGQAIR